MFKLPACKHRPHNKLIFLLILILWITDSKATEPPSWQGQWHGKLQLAPGMSLNLVLHLSEQQGRPSATLDSPDQGARGIAASDVSVTGPELKLSLAAIGANYSARLEGEQLIGSFSQAGQQLPLRLTRMSAEQIRQMAAEQANARPQEPQAPFPYLTEQVTYPHPSGNFNFAATLTKPKGKGPFAAAILISGSGQQDRDETLSGHKPFKLLADTLSREGFAVLRFDDRGTAQSGGTFAGSTLDDFASDVQAAFDYLQSRADINPQQIGLIGHSEGGVTGPMFAARQPKVAFVIMLAGLGVPGTQLWATQQRDIGLASGLSDGEMIYRLHYQAASLAAQGASITALKTVFANVAGANQALIDNVADTLASPWGRSLMAYQPQPVLSQLNMPLLAINGELDLQVAARDNLSAIQQIMANTANPDVTVLSLPGLNHLFQKAKTGHPMEYGQISETLNPALLAQVSSWLKARY